MAAPASCTNVVDPPPIPWVKSGDAASIHLGDKSFCPEQGSWKTGEDSYGSRDIRPV